MQRLQRDLAESAHLEQAILAEERDREPPEVGAAGVVGTLEGAGGGAERGRGGRWRREVGEIARHLGMERAHAEEMYKASVAPPSSSPGAVAAADPASADPVVLSTARALRELPVPTLAHVAPVLAGLVDKGDLSDHEKALLLKRSVHDAPPASPSSSPSASPSSSPSKDPPVSLPSLLRALLSLRRLHALAQVEGSPPADDDADTVTASSILGGREYRRPRAAPSDLPPVKEVAAGAAPGTPRELLAKGPQSIPSLKRSLAHSSTLLSSLSSAVHRDVALVSQKYTVKSAHAREMSFVWGLDKLKSALDKTRLNYLRLSFSRYLRFAKYARNARRASAFLRSVAGRAMCRTLLSCLQRSFASSFLRWKQSARYARELEEHAAVLEVQAAARMRAAAKETQRRRERRAATNIGRVQRGRNGRRAAEARREYVPSPPGERSRARTTARRARRSQGEREDHKASLLLLLPPLFVA
jgi:hypothetical protein